MTADLSQKVYSTANNYQAGTLQLYLNGLRQRKPEAMGSRLGRRNARYSPNDTATQAVQYADVAATFENGGPDVTNARLTLHVGRDGQPVEDFALAAAMTLTWGQSQINQRYIPAGGWTAGTYSFSATLEQVDPSTGAATPLATAMAPATIVVA